MNETITLPELPVIADELTRITYGKIPFRGKATQNQIDYYAKRQERQISAVTEVYERQTYYDYETDGADKRYYRERALLYAKLTGDYRARYTVGYETIADARTVLRKYGVPLPTDKGVTIAHLKTTVEKLRADNTLHVTYTALVDFNRGNGYNSNDRYTVTVYVPESDLASVYRPTYFNTIVTDGKRLYNYAEEETAPNGDVVITAVTPNNRSYGYVIASRTKDGLITVKPTITKELQSALTAYLSK